MLLGSLVELHAWLHPYLCFSFLEKRFLSNPNTSLISPRHLAFCRALKVFSYRNLDRFSTTSGSNEKVLGSSIASQQLVGQLSFSSCVFTLFFDSFLIAVSVDVVFIDTYLDRWLDTSRRLYLLRITEVLYIGLSQSGSHFLWSLLIYPHLFLSQTPSLSLQTSS